MGRPRNEVQEDTGNLNLNIKTKRNVKNLLFVLLAMLFVACSSSPEVTSCEPVTVDNPIYETDYNGNISFRGTKKVTGFTGTAIKNVLIKVDMSSGY